VDNSNTEFQFNHLDVLASGSATWAVCANDITLQEFRASIDVYGRDSIGRSGRRRRAVFYVDDATGIGYGTACGSDGSHWTIDRVVGWRGVCRGDSASGAEWARSVVGGGEQCPRRVRSNRAMGPLLYEQWAAARGALHQRADLHGHRPHIVAVQDDLADGHQ
jgi:hypothetical protein